MAGNAQQSGIECLIVHDLKVISETAERLGKKADADRYRRQLEATTKAYIEKLSLIHI